MTEPGLLAKITSLQAALAGARIPSAFGGALALGYYAEPRATHDIDVNVFVGPAEEDRVRRALEGAVGGPVPWDVAAIERDGQFRTWWNGTPVDLFFASDPVHDAMAGRVRTVPLGDGTITVLSPEDLIVCKAVFDRPKDWVDIEAAVEVTPVDRAVVLSTLRRLVEDDDPRLMRLGQVLGDRAG